MRKLFVLLFILPVLAVARKNRSHWKIFIRKELSAVNRYAPILDSKAKTPKSNQKI